MKAFLAFLLMSVAGLATTLTGTLNGPNGVGVNGVLYLSLAQQAALAATGGCGGPIEVVPTYQVKITVTGGAVSGTVYGNDCMLPQGTYYIVKFVDNNGNTLFNDLWVISGASMDVGTIVSVAVTGTTTVLGQPGVILTQPVISQVLAQPPGTNLGINLLNVTNTFNAPSGAVCNLSGCTGFSPSLANYVQLTGVPQTISSQLKLTQSIVPNAFAPNLDVGSPTYYWDNGWYNGTVIQKFSRVFFGDIGDALPGSDWVEWHMTAINDTVLIDSVDQNILETDTFDVLAGAGNPYNLLVSGNVVPSQRGIVFGSPSVGTVSDPWPDGWFTALNITSLTVGSCSGCGGGGGGTSTIATGTAALGTSPITSATCATAVTGTATGANPTTDALITNFGSDPTGTTGYVPGTMLSIVTYLTTDTANFLVCNNTSGSITPGAVTLSFKVVR